MSESDDEIGVSEADLEETLLRGLGQQIETIDLGCEKCQGHDI